MAPVDETASLAPHPPAHASAFERGLTTTFAALAWGTAGWLTFVVLPATRRMIEEFNLEADPLTLWVLRTAWVVTPVLAVLSIAIYCVMPVRWIGRCSLLLPPLAIAGVEGGLHLFYLSHAIQKLG